MFDGLDTARVIAHFRHYLQRAELSISRAEAEQRMFAKLRNPRFLADMRPLLPPSAADAITDETVTKAFSDVFNAFVIRLPGEPWARTEEMTERFGTALNLKP